MYQKIKKNVFLLNESETIISALANQTTFSDVITAASAFAKDKCSSFLKQSAILFAKYAVKSLV